MVEQELNEQILQDERENETQIQKRQASISLQQTTALLRLKEDRSIDPTKPPLVLDIPAARTNVKALKYSSLGKSIRYVFLKHPSDSTFFKHQTRILFTQSNIIASTWKGIARFDKQGQFIEMICNDGQKFVIDAKLNALYTSPEMVKQYVGSQGSVSAIGDRLFYTYVDNPNKEAYFMEYDASLGKQSFLMPQQNEQNRLNGKGEIIANLSGSKSKGAITLLNEDHWFSTTKKFESSKTGVFMTVHSLSGDTVCTMKDYDPVSNFSNSSYRGVEDGDNYLLSGKIHIRQNFNDTVFYFGNARRLVPKYVIHFGKNGVQSSQDAISPKVSLKDKFVYKGIVESNDFLFFTYTQDYECPRTARDGTLKYNRFVLNKSTGEQFHAYIDAKPYTSTKTMTMPSSPQINSINDLDFGPSRWPISVDNKGHLYVQLSGEELKIHVNENQCHPNTTNRQKLETLASNCSANDLLLMIIQ